MAQELVFLPKAKYENMIQDLKKSKSYDSAVELHDANKIQPKPLSYTSEEKTQKTTEKTIDQDGGGDLLAGNSTINSDNAVVKQKIPKMFVKTTLSNIIHGKKILNLISIMANTFNIRLKSEKEEKLILKIH